MNALEIGSKEFVLEAAKCYIDDQNLTASGFGKKVGIAPRRMQKIIKGDVTMRNDEAMKIALMVRVPFDKSIEDEPQTSPKPTPKKDKAEAIGIRGDARVLVQMYREAKGFKTDTDAATYIVKSFFMNLLKEAADVEG